MDVPKDNCGRFAVADSAQDDPKCMYAANGRQPYFAFFASWPYGSYKGSIPDALPVFDINFVNDINYCNGSVCRNAAAAVDAAAELSSSTSASRTSSPCFLVISSFTSSTLSS